MVNGCEAVDEPMLCVPKLKLAGLSVIAGPVMDPVPLSAMVCGLPAALSTRVMVAVRAPKSLGLNVMLRTVLLCGETVNGGVGPTKVKSVALAPVMVTDETMTLPIPTLLMISGFELEAVFKLVARNATDVVFRPILAFED